MKIACGTDIIEIARIKRSIEEIGKDFLKKIYTEKEIQYCESKKVQKYQHYAARFAAKEAIFKAISPSLKDKYEIPWNQVEVLNDSQGRPYINFLNKKIDGLIDVDISISHCKEYATANVIVTFEN